MASWLNFSLCTFAWIIPASNHKTNNSSVFFYNFSRRTDLWSDSMDLFILYRILTLVSKLQVKAQEVEGHF